MGTISEAVIMLFVVGVLVFSASLVLASETVVSYIKRHSKRDPNQS